MTKYFDWYDQDILVAHVSYTGTWPTAHLQDVITCSSDILLWPLSEKCDASLNYLFESRLAPRKNFDTKAQRLFGLSIYHAEQMCRITHGAMAHDCFWMKFESDPEDLCWRDVAVDNYWRE